MIYLSRYRWSSVWAYGKEQTGRFLRQFICSWSRILKATKPWFEVKHILDHTMPPESLVLRTQSHSSAASTTPSRVSIQLLLVDLGSRNIGQSVRHHPQITTIIIFELTMNLRPNPHRLLWLSWSSILLIVIPQLFVFMSQQYQETSTKLATAQHSKPWYGCSSDCSPFSISYSVGRLGTSLGKCNCMHISQSHRSYTDEFERLNFHSLIPRWH